MSNRRFSTLLISTSREFYNLLVGTTTAITGTGALTITAVTLAGTGQKNGAPQHITGTGALTVIAVTASGAGKRGIVDLGGAVAFNLPVSPSSSGSGTKTAITHITGSGALSASLGTQVAGSGTKNSLPIGITGSGALVVGSVVLAAQGKRGIKSTTASLTIQAVTLRGSAPGVGLSDNHYRKIRVFYVSASGRVRWVSYIPVKTFLSTDPKKVDRYDDDGALSITALSSTSGLREWVDYIPVVEVSDPDSGKWRFDATGFLPVVPII